MKENLDCRGERMKHQKAESSNCRIREWWTEIEDGTDNWSRRIKKPSLAGSRISAYSDADHIIRFITNKINHQLLFLNYGKI